MRFVFRMLPISLLMVAAILVVGKGNAQTLGAAAQKAEGEIRAAIMDFAGAYNSNNVEHYFAYYAPDLITWWPGARRMEKETYHKSWTENVEKGGGVSSGEVADLRIQIAPAADAAVASYLLKVKRKGVPPDRVDVEYQMSPTLFKRDGKWQVVHLQFSTRMPPVLPPTR